MELTYRPANAHLLHRDRKPVVITVTEPGQRPAPITWEGYFSDKDLITHFMTRCDTCNYKREEGSRDVAVIECLPESLARAKPSPLGSPSPLHSSTPPVIAACLTAPSIPACWLVKRCLQTISITIMYEHHEMGTTCPFPPQGWCFSASPQLPTGTDLPVPVLSSKVTQLMAASAA